jgi:hypothetical protein
MNETQSAFHSTLYSCSTIIFRKNANGVAPARNPSSRLRTYARRIKRRLKVRFPTAICPLTSGVFKSLDYASMPQSKQNIS